MTVLSLLKENIPNLKIYYCSHVCDRKDLLGKIRTKIRFYPRLLSRHIECPSSPGCEQIVPRRLLGHLGGIERDKSIVLLVTGRWLVHNSVASETLYQSEILRGLVNQEMVTM